MVSRLDWRSSDFTKVQRRTFTKVPVDGTAEILLTFEVAKLFRV